jgi:transposase
LSPVGSYLGRRGRRRGRSARSARRRLHSRSWAAWLTEGGVTHVALEATGIYWQPLWNVLEDRFVLILANAQHIRAVPGRKTDVRDAEWIAELLRHGLIRPSFVPARPQRELRELVRYRTSLTQEPSAEVNRLQKTLEGANLKLGDVPTNIMGRSGRAMLEALVAGERDVNILAGYARGRLRTKRAALEEALRGSLGASQRFLLQQQLLHIDQLGNLIEAVSVEIERCIAAIGDGPVMSTDPSSAESVGTTTIETQCLPVVSPRTDAVERLDTIPGVGRRLAEILVAEIGVDMEHFGSAAHLASWAGMCPGNHQSAGKRHSGRTRKGSRWLRTALVEAAQAVQRAKNTYLAAQFRRLTVRRGLKKAAVAVGHTILVIAYHLLRDGGVYRDLGPAYFDERDRRRVRQRLVQRLQNLGYTVSLSVLPT